MLFGKPGSDHKAGNCLPAGDSKLMISETGLLENIETHAKKINGGMPFDVSAHLRHLPDGRKASDFQIGLAEGKGIIVPEGMTYVKDFTKNK